MSGVLQGRAVWGLSDVELSSALERITTTERQLAAERLAIVGEMAGRGLIYAQGHATVAGWVNTRLAVGVTAASRMAKLIKQLPEVPLVAKALADGEVSEQQAFVIATAVAAFTGRVKTEAQEALIAHAPVLKPEELAVAGRRVLHLVDPAAAEEHERKQLEREEERGWEDRGFSLSADGTGRVRISGHTDAEGAAIIRSALDPLCNPARRIEEVLDGAEEPLPLPLQDNRTAGQRRHDALIEVFQRCLDAGELPVNGGEKPQVVLTLPFDPIAGAVLEATLDTGEHLTAQAARRLACDCGLIPAVLNGNGIPLDLGRERRLISGPLRRALVLRDRGCAFPACDRPPKWCHGHHVISWLDGGKTCLENSVLVCGFHHRLIHQGDWTVVIAADGIPEFIPPVWLDLAQLPRRNTYHRRT